MSNPEAIITDSAGVDVASGNANGARDVDRRQLGPLWLITAQDH